METKKFSIVQALQFGFYTVIENILFFLALWLICLGVFLVGLIIAKKFTGMFTTMSFECMSTIFYAIDCNALK